MELEYVKLLGRIALELLEKYHEAEDGRLVEYGGPGDFEVLEEEVEKYKQEITEVMRNAIRYHQTTGGDIPHNG